MSDADDYPQLARQARDASERHYKRALALDDGDDALIQLVHIGLAIFFELRHQTHLMHGD